MKKIQWMLLAVWIGALSIALAMSSGEYRRSPRHAHGMTHKQRHAVVVLHLDNPHHVYTCANDPIVEVTRVSVTEQWDAFTSGWVGMGQGYCE